MFKRKQAVPERRSLAELTLTQDPAWPTIQGWVAASRRTVQVLRGPAEERAATLVELQVTTHSALGAMAFETSGMVLDHGWLRLLGGAGSDLPALATDPGRFVVLAHDVLGGSFAVNGGGLPVQVGEVAYRPPLSQRWEPTGMKPPAFLQWALGGDTRGFYEDARWPGWQLQVEQVGLDEGLVGEPRQVAPWAEVVAQQGSAPPPVAPPGNPFRLGF